MRQTNENAVNNGRARMKEEKQLTHALNNCMICIRIYGECVSVISSKQQNISSKRNIFLLFFLLLFSKRNTCARILSSSFFLFSIILSLFRVNNLCYFVFVSIAYCLWCVWVWKFISLVLLVSKKNLFFYIIYFILWWM